MNITIGSILRKIFVHGFYRAHSGMLIFLSATVFSCCFFVNTLGELPPGTYFFWHFILTITLVSNPLMAVMFFVACLFYALRNLQFVRSELQRPVNQLLRYSISALPLHRQMRLWLSVEVSVFLPLIIYSLFCIFMGVVTGHLFMAMILMAYICLLVVFCSYHIFQRLNQLHVGRQYWYDTLFRRWRKPFFVLFTCYILHQRKTVLLLTKLTSLAIIVIIFYNYPSLKHDLKTSCLVVLLMIVAHIVLIYQEQYFNNRYLSFSYNFPYSLSTLFWGYTVNYLLLLAPEISWLFCWFPLLSACMLSLTGFSLLLLIRSISFSPSLHLFSLLKIIFLILCILFLMTAYHFYWIIAPICLLLSYIIFQENYFYKHPA